jgi:membrane protein implicated in regulation of membrane protease activity
MVGASCVSRPGTVKAVDSGSVAVAFVVLAVVLSALEIVAPGLVLLPFGLGAGVAAVAGFLGAPPLLQAAVFVIASFAFYLGLRPLARRLDDSAPSDGIGAQRLIGATGVVLERIESGDTGLVRIDREEWRAEAESGQVLVPGMGIRVTELRGTRVVVVPEHISPLGRTEAGPGDALGRGEGTTP